MRSGGRRFAMYLIIAKFSFCLIALILTLLLILMESGITDRFSPMKASDFVSGVTIFMLLYTISAIFLFLSAGEIYTKTLILFFGFSPFIIGQFATYKKLKLYSYTQIFCVILSLGYVLHFV